MESKATTADIADPLGSLGDSLITELRNKRIKPGTAKHVLEMDEGVLFKKLVSIVIDFMEVAVRMTYKIVTVDFERAEDEFNRAIQYKSHHANYEVIREMPKGIGGRTKIYFFKVGREISHDDLELEYASRGLVPVDPYSLTVVNECDIFFVEDHPNMTHWKFNDRWCVASFSKLGAQRYVDVDYANHTLGSKWWCAGILKE